MHIEYIQPENPQRYAYIEQYNRTLRYRCMSKHLFETLDEVQDYAPKWLWLYNHERPLKANGGKSPLIAA